MGYIHEVIREDSDVGDNLLPKAHLVASLLKRWLLGTYQGAVLPVHLDYYLDEYPFALTVGHHAPAENCSTVCFNRQLRYGP